MWEDELDLENVIPVNLENGKLNKIKGAIFFNKRF